MSAATRWDVSTTADRKRGDAIDEPRLISLRRPAVVNLVPGAFVPAEPALEAIDAAWSRLREQNPRFFDGRVLHVLGVSRNGHGGVVVHVMEAAYRFYAVIAGGLDTGVRPLGVKGLAEVDGDDGTRRWLMGRRSDRVAYYPDRWEFVPGGCLEPGVDPAEMLLRELGEESGFEAASPPVPVALLYDPSAFSWELVHRVAIRPRAGIDPPGWEYRELRWVALGEEPQPLSPIARRMQPLRSEP